MVLSPFEKAVIEKTGGGMTSSSGESVIVSASGDTVLDKSTNISSSSSSKRKRKRRSTSKPPVSTPAPTTTNNSTPPFLEPVEQRMSPVNPQSKPSSTANRLASSATSIDRSGFTPDGVISRNTMKRQVDFSNVPKPSQAFKEGFVSAGRDGYVPLESYDKPVERFSATLGAVAAIEAPFKFRSAAKPILKVVTAPSRFITKALGPTKGFTGFLKRGTVQGAEGVAYIEGAKLTSDVVTGVRKSDYQEEFKTAYSSGLAAQRATRDEQKFFTRLNKESRDERKKSFVSGVSSSLTAQGVPTEQVSSLTKSATTRRSVVKGAEVFSLVNIASGTEIPGRASFNTIIKKFGKKSADDKALARAAKLEFKYLGASEGAASTVVTDRASGDKTKPRDLAVNAALGAASASVLGYPILKAGITRRKTKGFLLETGGSIADVYEKPGDLLADFKQSVTPRSRVISFTGGRSTTPVSTSTPVSNVIPSTSVSSVPRSVNPPPKVTVPVRTPTVTEIPSFVDDGSRRGSSRTRPVTPPVVPPITPSITPTPTIIPSVTTTPVSTTTTTPVSTNTFVNTLTPTVIPSNIVTPQIKIAPLLPRGGGKGLFGGSRFSSQKKSYTPSFTALAFNIKGKATRGSVTSGLGLRPITKDNAPKKKKKVNKSLFGGGYGRTF